MIKYQNSVASTIDGTPIVGAQVAITVFGQPGTEADVYADENGTTQLTQPLVTNQQGSFFFYAADGRYTVTVTAATTTISQTDITIVDTLSVKGRALLAPENDSGSIIPPVAERAGKLLMFNDDGTSTAALPNSFPGPAGTSDNTYTSLPAFKASDIARKTASLVGVSGVPDGRFNWTVSNFTGQADDVNIIKADNTSLATGAWVRQTAKGLAFVGDDAGSFPRDQQSVNMDRRSLLSFIPAIYHAAIRSRTIATTVDLGPYIRNAFAVLPPGATLIAPDGMYPFSTPAERTSSIDMRGAAGQKNFDNSWPTCGTVFAYYGDKGDALTFRPVNDEGKRYRLTLRDFTVRGARVSRSSTATSGHGIVIDGRQRVATAIHPNVENVFVAEAKECGWLITGAVYGGQFSTCGAYNNGKNGRRIIGQADPIGELTWYDFEAFENGFDATAGSRSADGVWDSPGGFNNRYYGLSTNGNAGYGATLEAGFFTGSGWQFESVRGTVGLNLGSAGAGISGLDVDGLLFSASGALYPITETTPGSGVFTGGYTGTFITISPFCYNVALSGLLFSDQSLGAGGKDIYNAGSLTDIRRLRAGHPPVIQNVANDAFIEGTVAGQNQFTPTVRATRGTDVVTTTGNGSDYVVIFDNELEDSVALYNSATGVLTFAKTGRSHIDVSVVVNGLTSNHDRILLTAASSNSAKSLLERGGNPYNARDANGNSPIRLSGVVSHTAGDTMTIVLNVANGENNVVVIKSVVTRLALMGIA